MGDLAGRIKRARKRAGLTQEGVARRAEISLNGYTDLERGIARNPHISTLRSIAGVLKVPVGDLVDEESTRTIMSEADLDKWAEEEPWAREQIEALRSSVRKLGEDEGLQFTLRVTFSKARERSSTSTPWSASPATEGG
jgi:transcriptional regulator with XRE-family HTH domain